MTKTRKILLLLLYTAVWGAVGTYFFFAVRECRSRRDGLMVNDLHIEVRDSAMGFVTAGMVREWFDEGGLVFRGMRAAEINTAEVERFLRGRGFVKSADVYTDLTGRLTIELTQRRPLMRVKTTGGYDFFVTDDGYVLPARSRSARYLQVVTGDFTPPFEEGFEGSVEDKMTEEEKNSDKNYLFFTKLVNFARLVENDRFWSSQIVQTVASADGTLELVPRAGNHVILFGEPEDAQRKLEKLKLFYKNALSWEGWSNWRCIDIRYDNQIVCTK